MARSRLNTGALLYMLGNLYAFLASADVFKRKIFKKFFQKYHQSVKHSGSRSGLTKSRVQLGSKLFAEVKSRRRHKQTKSCCLNISQYNTFSPLYSGNPIMGTFGPLELIFSSSKTMPLYLQYGKELFASWPWHTPLTGLPDPNPSPINHPWNIRGCHVQDLYPSPASKLVSQWQCIPQEGGGSNVYSGFF